MTKKPHNDPLVEVNTFHPAKIDNCRSNLNLKMQSNDHEEPLLRLKTPPTCRGNTVSSLKYVKHMTMVVLFLIQ